MSQESAIVRHIAVKNGVAKIEILLPLSRLHVIDSPASYASCRYIDEQNDLLVRLKEGLEKLLWKELER